MDEYAREIRDLQVQVDQLVEAEEQPETIVELERQIAVLRALYERARELYQEGESDALLRRSLSARGYGPWTLDNVYAFVYETAVDVPSSGPREFLDVIHHQDFRSLLEPRAPEL